MRETTRWRLETSANVAIIIVALMACALCVTIVLPKLQVRSLVPGSQIKLHGIDWKSNDRTLLLALSTSCHFCSQSASFYKRLVTETASKSSVQIIAVLPEDIAEGTRFLRGLGVPATTVLTAQLRSFGVRGTPTIILADNKGTIKHVWEGTLSLVQEEEVLGSVR